MGLSKEKLFEGLNKYEFRVRNNKTNLDIEVQNICCCFFSDLQECDSISSELEQLAKSVWSGIAESKNTQDMWKVVQENKLKFKTAIYKDDSRLTKKESDILMNIYDTMEKKLERMYKLTNYVIRSFAFELSKTKDVFNTEDFVKYNKTCHSILSFLSTLKSWFTMCCSENKSFCYNGVDSKIFDEVLKEADIIHAHYEKLSREYRNGNVEEMLDENSLEQLVEKFSEFLNTLKDKILIKIEKTKDNYPIIPIEKRIACFEKALDETRKNLK